MPRAPTGQVVETPSADGKTYALRFRAYGRRRYLTLGTAAEGWTRAKAQLELQNVLADVRRGLWKPPARDAPPAPTEDPTFHEFASRWLDSRQAELKARTIEDYTWALCEHRLPFFHKHRLGQITIAEVDRYRTAKLKEGLLSPTSINKTITRLAQILDVAMEYHPDLVRGNPARGRRRRLKTTPPHRAFLEADQVAALLEAAGELDAKARRNTRHLGRRATLATLALAGLRVGELSSLRWQDVDLASGRIYVRDAKTPAGVRAVNIGGILRDELAVHRAGSRFAAPENHVFCTEHGRGQERNNIRSRILRPAVALANEHLAKRGQPPIDPAVTLHALRRTFISLLLESGENPRVVMQQVGHAHPELTLRVYAQVMTRREGDSTRRVDELIRGADWAVTGRNAAPTASQHTSDTTPPDPKPR
jgi:integrase